MEKIDWNKPVRTRDGRAVRVLCTDRATPSEYPVVALVKEEQGDEAVYTYTMEGKYYRFGPESGHDLENVPYLESDPKVTNLWANVYPDDVSGHASRGEADYWGEDDRVALLRLTVVDGILVGMEIEG